MVERQEKGEETQEEEIQESLLDRDKMKINWFVVLV